MARTRSGGGSGSSGGGAISRTLRSATNQFKPPPKRTVNPLPGSGAGPSARPGGGVGGRQPRPTANTGATMPYEKSRPSYKTGQVEQVWADAKDSQGRVWVKNMAGQQEEVRWQPGEPRQGVWDMGHLPGHEYRDLKADYMAHKITKEEFVAQVQNPKNYFVEHPLRNQSHIDEQGR